MKRLDNNRMLKLIALAIAIVLWLYVGTQEDPLAQHTYEVAVEIENLPVDKTATLGSDTVKVRVMGRQGRLSALSSSDFTATVDLSEVEDGEQSLPVQVTLPGEVYFARTTPSMVTVTVEQREGSNMDVELKTTGELPDGISIQEMQVSPEQVFVTGDSGALAQVASAGVEVDLSTILEDSEERVQVQLYDTSGAPIDDESLEVLPGTVTLTIDVDESEVEKSVPIQANLSGQLPQGVQIESVSISPETATVSGTPQELEEIISVETAAIDLSQISETTTLSVALTGKHVVSPANVSVTLNVTQTQSEQPGSMKMVPVSISGAAAGSVYTDVQMVEVSYHMQPGYEDAGNALSAYILVDQIPSGAQTVQVQLSYVDGLVVDAVTPQTVTIYPNTDTTTDQTY